MVSFILSFATSPLANTKQAALHFADGSIPIPPPSAQYREAPAALTTALATLSLVPVPLPADMLAITTIDTDQTVKLLCFPAVTSSADGDPHYLLDAYTTGDKHNWFHTTMITGYCGWNIGTSFAYAYHFDPTFTPASINTLPTAQVQAQHHDTPTT
eukprot:jgi/Psemu1/4493/gm1.4493_g